MSATWRAQASKQARRRREINFAWFVAEVVLSTEIVKSSQFGRFDYVINSPVAHLLLIGHASSGLLKGFGANVDEPDGKNLTRVLQRDAVEDSCRHAEALVGLPRGDEILKGRALFKAAAENGYEHLG